MMKELNLTNGKTTDSVQHQKYTTTGLDKMWIISFLLTASLSRKCDGF